MFIAPPPLYGFEEAKENFQQKKEPSVEDSFFVSVLFTVFRNYYTQTVSLPGECARYLKGKGTAGQ